MQYNYCTGELLSAKLTIDQTIMAMCFNHSDASFGEY